MTADLPARLLRLLSLLQGRREWSGGELADRLGVSGRTVRRDVDRLRELGYPVEGTTGTAGGYRLASGRNLPPLLLDDDEAVAIAVGLRTAAGAGVAGIDETAVRALAKLEQVLPARLRGRVTAVGQALVGVRQPGGGPEADPRALAVLAAACRDRELVTFDYRGRSGAAGSRRVEPYGLVVASGLWYLIAYDLRRDGWRTFRLDRLDAATPVRLRFTPRPLPAPNAAAYLSQVLAEAPYRYTARAEVPASVQTVRERVPTLLPGKIEPLGADRCAVTLGSDSLDRIVRDLLALDTDVTLEADAEVLDHLRTVAHRLQAMTGDPSGEGPVCPGSRTV
ncbi:helix-turn-helix transcriptional regulator [Pseudonocardia acaciae]|uniref:helix-turn-helix transcriptional regulator n=1 Tax=Pseudonocardia acaciae TaxID=551276 RepID=UPI000686762A|nr:YafY family protein [Pseudonocardia acaciae]